MILLTERINLTESEGRGLFQKRHVFDETRFSASGGAGMGPSKSGDAALRFSACVDGLSSVIAHPGRAKPLRDYCTGLIMPCEHKSVEPMAALTAPERTSAQHQSLLRLWPARRRAS
jgi:hypothetical protein